MNLGECFKMIMDFDDDAKHNWVIKITANGLKVLGFVRSMTTEEITAWLTEQGQIYEGAVKLQALPYLESTKIYHEGIYRILERGSRRKLDEFDSMCVFLSEDPPRFEATYRSQ